MEDLVIPVVMFSLLSLVCLTCLQKIIIIWVQVDSFFIRIYGALAIIKG